MRLFFALIFLLHSLLSHAQEQPIAPAAAKDTGNFVQRMGILTDTIGVYKVIVGSKRLRIRHMTLYSRVELLSNGTRREIERYLYDDRRRRRYSGDVWNAIPVTKAPKK